MRKKTAHQDTRKRDAFTQRLAEAATGIDEVKAAIVFDKTIVVTTYDGDRFTVVVSFKRYQDQEKP